MNNWENMASETVGKVKENLVEKIFLSYLPSNRDRWNYLSRSRLRQLLSINPTSFFFSLLLFFYVIVIFLC